MTPDDYQPPFETDADQIAAADQAAEEPWYREAAFPEPEAELPEPDADTAAPEQDDHLAELAEPFVGQWNQLISTTNWEKGRIIHEWRERLIESGAAVTEYSDEAWAQRVGGVTAPHVGRLRRVYDHFGSTFETYEGLYWSHFLAALDWDDSPLWLEGASREGWSVSQMREQRWQAHGAVESQRPTSSKLVDVDTDEDVVLPAQGAGRNTQGDGDPDAIHAGQTYEEPDFGEGDELMSLGSAATENDESGTPAAQSGPEVDDHWEAPVQPFAGLPELPDDLADAIEQLKLALLRHKTGGWTSVTPETMQRYLDAMGILLRS